MHPDTAPRVLRVIVETLGVQSSRVVLEASLCDDLDADALDMVGLAMNLEEEFATDLPDEVITACETVQQVIDQVEKTRG